MLNVKDLGVVGDGLTDDTAAINAADSYASSINETLFFPASTYLASALTNSVPWSGDGDRSVILRLPSSPTGVLLSSSGDLCLSDIVLDGNKANNTTGSNNITGNCSSVKMSRVIVRNAKSNAGWGAGAILKNSDGDSFIEGCSFYGNEFTGLSINKTYGIRVEGNKSYDNGGDGIELNNLDPTFMMKVNGFKVIGNHSRGNSRNGFVIGNFVGNNNMVSPVYDHSNIEANTAIISNNIAESNDWYGFAISGYELNVHGNVARNNALTQPTFAGFVFSGLNSKLTGNISSRNAGCGIDMGGAVNCLVSGNTVLENASTGINSEGNQFCKISGNHIGMNGASSGIQILVERYGAADALNGFAATAKGIDVSDNYIIIDSSREGIRFDSNPSQCSAERNTFQLTNPPSDISRCIRAFGASVLIRENTTLNRNYELVTMAGGSFNIPDVLDFAISNSATTISSLQTVSQALVGYGIAYITLTNGGSGYTSQPSVSFSGGGGSGSSAYTIINKSGSVTGIRVTSFGSGYTSAPTVTISGGGGSGATGVAQFRLPPVSSREITIMAATAQTVSASGWWPVIQPSNANIPIPAGGMITIIGYYDRWNLKSKNW